MPLQSHKINTLSPTPNHHQVSKSSNYSQNTYMDTK